MHVPKADSSSLLSGSDELGSAGAISTIVWFPFKASKATLALNAGA